MERLGVTKRISSEYAHFDPWLIDCPWLSDESKHLIGVGVLGQIRAAAGHLRNQLQKTNIDDAIDSLFLFFSRFKDYGNIDDKGAYYIYGWLQVDHVINNTNFNPNGNDAELLKKHPHFTKDYFKAERNNTIYVAKEFLDDSKIPGCGYFTKLTETLRLSSPSNSSPSWSPLDWELPAFFNNKDKIKDPLI